MSDKKGDKKADAEPASKYPVNLLDWHGDAYGKVIRVEFLKKLRDEEKFVDLPTLTAAIQRDVDNARAWFAAHGNQRDFATSATDRI